MVPGRKAEYLCCLDYLPLHFGAICRNRWNTIFPGSPWARQGKRIFHLLRREGRRVNEDQNRAKCTTQSMITCERVSNTWYAIKGSYWYMHTERIFVLLYTSLNSVYNMNNTTLFPYKLYISRGYWLISFCFYFRNKDAFLKKNRKQCPLKAFCIIKCYQKCYLHKFSLYCKVILATLSRSFARILGCNK